MLVYIMKPRESWQAKVKKATEAKNTSRVLSMQKADVSSVI